MNSDKNGRDSIKRAQMPYFYCGPYTKNRKSEIGEKIERYI